MQAARLTPALVTADEALAAALSPDSGHPAEALGLLTDDELLAAITTTLTLAARLDAIQAALVAAADQRQSTATLHDVPTVDWLRHTGALSRSDA